MGHRLHGSPFLNATQQYYKSVWRQKAPPTKNGPELPNRKIDYVHGIPLA